MGQDGLALTVENDISASPRTTRLRKISQQRRSCHAQPEKVTIYCFAFCDIELTLAPQPFFCSEALLQILRCMNASFPGLD